MFSGFPMGPAASGRELSDIDQILFRVTKSRVHKSLQKRTSTIIIFSLCQAFPFIYT